MEASTFKDLLPEHSHRIFLQCVEIERFLLTLEKCEFNPFINAVQNQPFFSLYWNVNKAARNNRFLNKFQIE